MRIFWNAWDLKILEYESFLSAVTINVQKFVQVTAEQRGATGPLVKQYSSSQFDMILFFSFFHSEGNFRKSSLLFFLKLS